MIAHKETPLGQQRSDVWDLNEESCIWLKISWKAQGRLMEDAQDSSSLFSLQQTNMATSLEIIFCIHNNQVLNDWTVLSGKKKLSCLMKTDPPSPV